MYQEKNHFFHVFIQDLLAYEVLNVWKTPMRFLQKETISKNDSLQISTESKVFTNDAFIVLGKPLRDM